MPIQESKQLTSHHGIDLAVLAQVGEALADSTRRAILAQLAEGPTFSAELAEMIGASRQRTSNHLACLRGCGLVVSVDEGRRVQYELSDPSVGAILLLLSRLPLTTCVESVQG